MALVPVAAADVDRVKKAAEAVVLPDYAKRCAATYPDCAAVWNKTVGAAQGMTIK